MAFFRDIDWKVLRPARGWLLAKADPRVKKVAGGILLPDGLTGLEKVSIEMATVLKVGVGVSELLDYDIKPGERFCYRGFIKDVTWYMLEPAEDESTVFLIHSKDVLAVVEPGVEIGVYLEKSTARFELPEGAVLWDPMLPISNATHWGLAEAKKQVFLWDHDSGELLKGPFLADLANGWVVDEVDPAVGALQSAGPKRFGRFTGYMLASE